MTEESDKYNWIIGGLIILLIFIWATLKGQVTELENLVNDYSYALQRANDNIDEANSMIEDAQGYAWSSYEEMGYALDSLTTVDTISDPF